MKTKRCSKCKEVKPATDEVFPRDKRRKDGLCSWCRKCMVVAAKKTILRTKFHINMDIWKQMLDDSKGLCAICGKASDKLNIDHNHTNGQVRGLLCFRCNSAIGLMMEDEKIFSNAVNYLQKHAYIYGQSQALVSSEGISLISNEEIYK